MRSTITSTCTLPSPLIYYPDFFFLSIVLSWCWSRCWYNYLKNTINKKAGNLIGPRGKMGKKKEKMKKKAIKRKRLWLDNMILNNRFPLKTHTYTLIRTYFKRFRRNQWLKKPFKMIILKYLHCSDDKLKMNPKQWVKVRQIIFNQHIFFIPSFSWPLSLHWKRYLKLVDTHTDRGL